MARFIKLFFNLWHTLQSNRKSEILFD